MAMDRDEELPAICTGDRLALIPESFARLTGRLLIPSARDPARTLWDAPCAILAHGTEADPLFFYGNRLALRLFALPPERFVGMPSRLSAEAPLRDERLRLLQRVTRDGFIDDYAGVRISATGHRFRIERATVWNLIDADGRSRGQAATFRHWTPLD
ncbi:MEKHLA domain-containing protein [Flavisphingomonas formosensis]|uniref:MEKHLA domain-containing protein n=1 Tax=Flavisphingomonas formosensis TaxID=861534 RepID=UPI0012FB1500|nr:MEKHLA domain-containing protein [Sphingomonas formosensis]